MMKKKLIATLISMCAIGLMSCGSSSPDDPAACVNGKVYDGISRMCITPIDTDTSTDTGTDTGTATQTTVTTTTTVTATDTGTATWPAWCNGNPDAPELGNRVNMTGLWNVTCGTDQWNLYITVNNTGLEKNAEGYAFKTAELDLPDPIPSLTVYKGSAAANCVWLNPTAQNPSLMTTPPPVLKGTAKIGDANFMQVTGGPCTIEWRKENQDGYPHYLPPSQ